MLRFSKSKSRIFLNFFSLPNKQQTTLNAKKWREYENKSNKGLSKIDIMPAIFFMLALLFLPAMVNAQVLYGSLTGNVSDPKDAVIPGAKVEITNIGTGISKTVITDDRGSFLINDLQPGVYKVVISVNGFKTLLKDGIQINTNTITRYDSQLETGEVKETITISADSSDTTYDTVTPIPFGVILRFGR